MRYFNAHMIRLFQFVVLVFLMVGTECYSQVKNFKFYSVEDGLAQSQVNSIYQDSKGNLWIGTNGGGLSIFNGRSFKNYTEKEGLGSNIINSIIEDSKGRMWFATWGNGISMFDGKSFTIYTMDDGLCDDKFYDILEDSYGNIWFGSRTGITMYDGKEFKCSMDWKELEKIQITAINEDRNGVIWFGGRKLMRYNGQEFQIIESKELENIGITALHVDNKGDLWIGTWQNGVFKYDGSEFTSYTTQNGLTHNIVSSITEDKEGNIWLGTYGGLTKYNGSVFEKYTPKGELKVSVIYSLMVDFEGNLWIGTAGQGLGVFQGERFIHFNREVGINNDMIWSILEDRKGNMWFGTYGGGVSRVENFYEKIDAFKPLDIKHFTEKDGISNDRIYNIIEAKNGDIWFGTWNGLTKYDGKSFKTFGKKDGLESTIFYSIMEDKKGDLWVGTLGGAYKYDGTSFNKFAIKDDMDENVNIYIVYEDRKGNLWFGTEGEGVFKYNGNRLIQYTQEHGLASNLIISILQDEKENMWFGTYGGGISILIDNPQESTQIKDIKEFKKGGRTIYWDYVTTEDGLSDDGIILMIFDDKGNLWVGNNKGVDKFYTNGYYNYGTKLVENFGKEEGFVGIECNANATFKDSRGNLWFGTINGASMYNPGEDKINQAEPFTNIIKTRLFFEDYDFSKYADRINKATNLPEGLILPYDKNHLTFDFIGISLTIPEKVKYQYRLVGFDKDWSPITKETYATYSNLFHGNYEFQVRSCNNDGTWNKQPARFAFAIVPPVWKTPWFIILCLVSISGLLYLFVRLRTNTLQREKTVLADRVDERTTELKGAYENLKRLEKHKETLTEMIVHDLKNPLNSIIGFSKRQPGKNETEAIHQAGVQMYNMVLNILDVQKYDDSDVKLDKADYPLSLMVHDALRQIKLLIKQKSLKIENRVKPDYHATVDFEIISRVIVNMLTNSVKYSPVGGKVIIKADEVKKKGGDFLKVSIEDEGIGIPHENLEKIFDKYSQVDAKKLGQTRSTGIGLTFCKMMVEAHSGEIWALSEVGKGATFYFTIPKAEVEDMMGEVNLDALMTDEMKRLELSGGDKKILIPLLESFKQLEVYETSKNMEILNTLTLNGNEALNQWRSEMETAIFNCDETKYQDLLQLIE